MKLVICLVVIFHHSQSIRWSSKVPTSHGDVQGTIENSITGEEFVSFKGIPYATPPVGNLRFLDPLPAEPWNGTLVASKYGNHCLLPESYFIANTGNEDCLYLNIYTPSNFNTSSSPGKAVMVWMLGTARSSKNYGPDYLVRNDVIVVTVNHRTGILGFLNLDDEVATGNQGLKDRVLALKWIQQNIAYFGGNPNSVTIFGVGAGAASVHYLALSSMADGLFHKVIAQSGTALNPWAYLPYSQKIHVEELAAALGNSTKDPKELVAFLRTIDPVTLVAHTANDDRLRPFVPSVDDKSKNPFLPTPINITAQKGVNVPFLLGDVSAGGMAYLAQMGNGKWNLCNSGLEKCLSPSVLDMLNNKGISVHQIRKFYFGDKNISLATSVNYMRMQTDLQYTYGIHDTVAIQVSKQYPTYMYRFSYDSGNSFMKTILRLNMTAVAHFEDVKYIFSFKSRNQFQHLASPSEPITNLIINRITQMWTDFAKTGNPTPVNTTLPVNWEPVQNADTFDVMDISENLKMETIENINNRNLTDIQ